MQPIVYALALTLRGRAAYGFEFLRRIALNLRAQIRHLHLEAQAVRAIDDAIETRMAKFEAALANDPPALRRELLTALRATHTATETRATALAPTCPEHLLQE